MHIGQLTDCYLPVLNGVTNLVRTHKAQLERLGHRAPVFTAGHLGHPDQEQDVIRSWGIPLGDTGYFAAPSYSRPAQVLLAALDLLHVHHPFVAGRLALRYGRRFQLPIVYTNHTRLDLYAGIYVPRPFRRLARRMVRQYMARFAVRCDLVIAPSEGMAMVMRDQWAMNMNTPVVVVPNGVDFTRFKREQAYPGRVELGLPSEGLLAIYTGRLGVEKNLVFLLRAFARVAPTELNAHLLLLGEGPQALGLRQLAGELGLDGRVHFLGAVPYERVPHYLAAADLFVTASVSEVHPMSLIEALVAGLPAVGVVSPGVADTIEDGVSGLLATHSLVAFAEALRRLLDSADLRAYLAQGARKAGERYNIAHTTGRILELYEQTLKDRA